MYYGMKAKYTSFDKIIVTHDNTVFIAKKITTKDNLEKAYKEIIYFSYRSFNSPIEYQNQRFFNDTCTKEVIPRLGMHT